MTVRLHAAEFVFPGHPDKLCDAIADSLVAEAIAREDRALVGVEVAVHRGRVFVTGRIACRDAESIDVEGTMRAVYRSAGYGDGWHPAPEALSVVSDLCLGPLEDGEAEFRELADDQAICIGYAVAIPETNFLPVEQWVAGRIARRLHALRGARPDLGLGPDGKVLVLVREEGRSWSLEAFSCSLQQRAGEDDLALHRAVRVALGEEIAALSRVLPGLSPGVPESLTVNGAGAFEVGGPEGDNGLSGKKLVMDAYGPRVPIGGGAWSGKDFFKADRAGGLHARRMAKLAVRLGLADELRVTLGWFPGDRSARLLSLDGDLGPIAAVRSLPELTDLTIACSGTRFGAVGNLVEIARFGHFITADLPWEVIPKL
jgi:S-adenosylmethionine synthetase